MRTKCANFWAILYTCGGLLWCLFFAPSRRFFNATTCVFAVQRSTTFRIRTAQRIKFTIMSRMPSSMRWRWVRCSGRTVDTKCLPGPWKVSWPNSFRSVTHLFIYY